MLFANAPEIFIAEVVTFRSPVVQTEPEFANRDRGLAPRPDLRDPPVDYRITSSAMANSVSAMARPSALAVLAFEAISNFHGLLNRQVCRLFATKNAIDAGRAVEQHSESSPARLGPTPQGWPGSLPSVN
jgi:hypothetical protein